jgi:hypothetical protein
MLTVYDLLQSNDELPCNLGVDRSRSLNFRENLLGVLHWNEIYGLLLSFIIAVLSKVMRKFRCIYL